MGWFSDLTGGGAEEANRRYQGYMQQALGEMQGEEARGRGDITGYTQKALGYGAPYREAGREALSGYEATLGLGRGGAEQRDRAIDRFKAGPGYQYAVNQAMRGGQRGEAARGLGGSGAEEAELQRRREGFASQEYGQYQGRLASLAGAGEEASARAAQMRTGEGSQLANLGEYYGGQKAGLYGQMGQSAAEAKLAQASTLRQDVGAIGGAALDFATGGASGALSSIGGAAKKMFTPSQPVSTAPGSAYGPAWSTTPYARTTALNQYGGSLSPWANQYMNPSSQYMSPSRGFFDTGGVPPRATGTISRTPYPLMAETEPYTQSYRRPALSSYEEQYA